MGVRKYQEIAQPIVCFEIYVFYGMKITSLTDPGKARGCSKNTVVIN